MIKASSIDDLTLAVVAAVKSAVAYPVFDGPPSKLPDRGTARYVVIGAESLDPAEPVAAASMDQVWQGLGQIQRQEDLSINCVAVARASSIAQARSLAMGIIQDTAAAIPLHPTPETYNALVSNVAAVRVHNTTGGAIVQVEFTISASASLY